MSDFCPKCGHMTLEETGIHEAPYECVWCGFSPSPECLGMINSCKSPSTCPNRIVCEMANKERMVGYGE